jgi:uncharacterized membrane protein YqhA
MNISQVDKADLFWLVVIHMAFVVSGVLLALMDLLVGANQRKRHKAAKPTPIA